SCWKAWISVSVMVMRLRRLIRYLSLAFDGFVGIKKTCSQLQWGGKKGRMTRVQRICFSARQSRIHPLLRGRTNRFVLQTFNIDSTNLASRRSDGGRREWSFFL